MLVLCTVLTDSYPENQERKFEAGQQCVVPFDFSVVIFIKHLFIFVSAFVFRIVFMFNAYSITHYQVHKSWYHKPNSSSDYIQNCLRSVCDIICLFQ